MSITGIVATKAASAKTFLLGTVPYRSSAAQARSELLPKQGRAWSNGTVNYLLFHFYCLAYFALMSLALTGE
jgi:hypothetical protein